MLDTITDDMKCIIVDRLHNHAGKHVNLIGREVLVTKHTKRGMIEAKLMKSDGSGYRGDLHYFYFGELKPILS